MAEDRDRKPWPGGPGTTSDPNQSNREPARDREAEKVREAPVEAVPGGPREDRDDGEGGGR